MRSGWRDALGYSLPKKPGFGVPANCWRSRLPRGIRREGFKLTKHGQTLWLGAYHEWRGGALLGGKQEEAYFVKCDRTTMTQDDLDHGRLVCLVGVAAIRPAEFIIFRFGQDTAGTTA